MKYKIIFIIGLFTALYVIEPIIMIPFVLFKGDGGVFENLKMVYLGYHPGTKNIGFFWVIRIIDVLLSFTGHSCSLSYAL